MSGAKNSFRVWTIAETEARINKDNKDNASTNYKKLEKK